MPEHTHPATLGGAGAVALLRSWWVSTWARLKARGVEVTALGLLALPGPPSPSPSAGPASGAGADWLGVAMSGPTPTPGAGGSGGSGVGSVLSDPLGWVGGQVGSTVGNVLAQAWTTVMLAVWAAGLALLRLSFLVVDALATPDVSAGGPLAGALATTLWIGGVLAVVMLFVQLGAALIRRDGASIGRVLIGTVQFGAVWVCFLAVAAATVQGAAQLEHGILTSMLHVDTLAAWDWTSTWPRTTVDTAAATVLGISSLLLVIPAGFATLVVALVRDAALLVLVATAPISAAGLLHEGNRAWFWKTLRWFISAVLIGPLSALVLGIGVQLTHGVVTGAGGSTASAIGTAVVGAVLVAVAATSPLVLFRLLAFVEPSTVSGAAMRQAWADTTSRTPSARTTGPGSGAGEVAGGSGSGAAAADGSGRSAGEVGADTATASRFGAALDALGPVASAYGRGMSATVGVANRAVDLGTDVLGSAGVGHPGYSMTPADERALRDRGSGGGEPEADGTGGSPPLPSPPTPGGGPGGPAGPGAPGGIDPGAGSGSGGAGAGAGAGGGSAGVSTAEAGLMFA